MSHECLEVRWLLGVLKLEEQLCLVGGDAGLTRPRPGPSCDGLFVLVGRGQARTCFFEEFPQEPWVIPVCSKGDRNAFCCQMEGKGRERYTRRLTDECFFKKVHCRNDTLKSK